MLYIEMNSLILVNIEMNNHFKTSLFPPHKVGTMSESLAGLVKQVFSTSFTCENKAYELLKVQNIAVPA